MIGKVLLNEDGRLRTTLQIGIVSMTFLLISILGQQFVTTTLFNLVHKGVLPAGITENYFWSGLLPETVLNFIAGGLIIAWFKVINKKSCTEMGVPAIWKHLKWMGLGILTILVSSACITGVLFLIGDIRLTEVKLLSSVLQYFLMMSSVSFVEEVLNRGYIQSLVKSRSSLFWSCVIPSLVFMAFHLQNPGISVLGLTNIFLAGMFFSVMTYKTGNIWFSFGAHMVWNAGVACIFGLMEVSSTTGSILNFDYTRTTIFNGYAVSPLYGLVGTVMWLILIVVFAFGMKPRREEEQNLKKCVDF